MKLTILNKRIGFVCIFVCISVLMYGIIGIVNKNNKSLQVNSTPITNKTIVIDAGHGKPDEGAIGFNSTSEQAINLSIALKLQKLIEQSGAKVLLTRSDENGIYSTDSKSIRNKKISDTKNRVKIGNENDCDVFVSIHLNKFPSSSSYSGWQTFYQKNNDKSKRIAELIQENLNKNIDVKNDRSSLPITAIYIMDNLKIPAVIVECGFLSNPEETNRLKEDDYQNKLAWGIYIGLQNYFLEGETNE